MFEKLAIKNFQKHSHLEIELDPEVTTIVGPSDSGKSAVIRALRWLCQNSPSGIEFLKNGQTVVSVSLGVDGRLIERTKAASNNLYLVDGKELRAFGQGVPAEVEDILNLDEINFQGQMDSPYWLSLSPGEISRQLNALIDLSIIDETMKNINRTVSRAKVEMEVAQEHLKKKIDHLESMDWVPECQVDAVVVRAAEKTKGDKAIDLEDLKELTQGILEFGRESTSLRTKLAAVADVGKQASYVRTQQQVLDGVAGVLNGVEALQGSLQFRTISTDAVDEAKSRLDAALLKLVSIKKILEQAKAVAQVSKNKKVLVDITQVDVAREEMLFPKNRLDGLKKLVTDIEVKDFEIDGLLLRLADQQKTILEKTGGVCPTCGGPLK